MGSLSKDHGDGNENSKKAKGLDWQNNNTPFLYIFLPLVHDYDVKMPNFTFFGECEHKRTTFFFFSWNSRQSLKIQLQKIYQNLTNRTRWNKCDIVWNCAKSLSSSSSLISPNIPRAQSIGCSVCFDLLSWRPGELLFREQTEKPMKS